ncbi:MAG: peptidase MA family metallohydrolase [Myxococcaceae bacterium]
MTRLLAIGLTLLALAGPAAASGAAASPPQVPAGRPAIVAGELTTARFRILHTGRAEGAALALASTIEATRDHFREVLGRDWPGITEVRVGVGRDELEALAIPGGKVPSWASALAYPVHNVVLIEAHSLSQPDGQATLRHELSHVALGQLGGPWPRWFQEGLAVHLTGEQRYSMTHYATLFRAVRQDRVFHFEDLSDRWPDHPGDVEIAYAQSAAFLGYLVEHHGPGAMSALLDAVGQGEPFETSFGKAFRTSLLLEEGAWRRELPQRYSWVPIVTGGSTLWALAAGITVFAFVRRKRLNAKLRAEQAAEEAAHDAAVRILEAEARAEPAPHPEELGPHEHDDEPEDELEKHKPTLH